MATSVAGMSSHPIDPGFEGDLLDFGQRQPVGGRGDGQGSGVPRLGRHPEDLGHFLLIESSCHPRNLQAP